MNDTETLSKLCYEIKSLRDDVKDLESMFAKINTEVSAIHDMANRWRGGFVVLLGLGGIIGWIAAVMPNFVKVFGK